MIIIFEFKISFIHLFIYSFIHLFIYLFIHSFIHLFIILLRLQKQKKELEERKYIEKIEMENKLTAIASERHRTKDIVSIAPILPSTENNLDEKKSLPKLNEKKKKKSTDPETLIENQVKILHSHFVIFIFCIFCTSE